MALCFMDLVKYLWDPGGGDGDGEEGPYLTEEKKPS